MYETTVSSWRFKETVDSYIYQTLHTTRSMASWVWLSPASSPKKKTFTLHEPPASPMHEVSIDMVLSNRIQHTPSSSILSRSMQVVISSRRTRLKEVMSAVEGESGIVSQPIVNGHGHIAIEHDADKNCKTLNISDTPFGRCPS